MSLKITNRARHLLIIPLNSGQTIHLAPGETSGAIEDYELENNEQVERLQRDGLLAYGTAEAGGLTEIAEQVADDMLDEFAKAGDTSPAATKRKRK